MKSDTRFIFEIYGPSFIGAAYLIAWNHFVQGASVESTAARDAVAYPMTTLAWFFTSVVIMSIIYAIIMEVAFDSGLRPHSWFAVLISETLGLVAGIVVSSILSGANTLFDQTMTYEVVGLATGMTMGLIVKLTLSRPKVALPLELRT